MSIKTTSRRILHQPFFPTSSSAPNSPPFFPSYDSPPPPPQPPPSPTAFASLPVNVSSLNVTKSTAAKSVSPSLLGVTIVALVLAVFVVVVATYYYCKRREKHFADNDVTKTYRSDNSNSRRLYPVDGDVVVGDGVSGGGGIRKVRSNSSRRTSSELLYFGNIVNSRRIEDRICDSVNESSGGGLNEKKLDSPELRPLPPLARYGNSGSVGGSGDEEDEFYSPKGSNSTAGSGSGRVFPTAAAVAELIGTSSESNSSSCSCSSSNLGSPVRSKTVSTSLPASLDHCNMSPSPSPHSISLPERSPVHAPLPPTLHSLSSPERSPVSAPLQPPPPPPLPTARTLESRTPPSPIIPHPISKSPSLIISPPKPTPIVFQSPTEGLPETVLVEKIEAETPKPKLKPLHWDKVRASSDREMVWDQLKSSSFKLNEEMIETLFVVNNINSNPKETIRRSDLPSPIQVNRVLDPKKSQNIAISLRALNVTVEEVSEALLEGNADTLGAELLESLLKMAPTKEEERKLKECKDDSPFKLGPAEFFLKEVLNIPFAFQRIYVMLYMANFESEVEYLKSSFETLEAACEELRNSRIFFKLLEAVLKTGNRMNIGTNRGDAHAFKLDTLLKLVDIKAADGKTTLLHFVVQKIIKSEGARISHSNNQISTPTLNEDAKCRKLGLQVVSNLRLELTSVKKAAAMDSNVLTSEVIKLSKGIENIGEVMALIGEKNMKFFESTNKFVNMAEEEIIRIQAQESVSLSLVKEITEYFHGNSAKEEAHPFRIFMVVRDFLAVLDRVCKDIATINERTIVSSAHKFPIPVNPTLQSSVLGFHQSSLDKESPSS